jgi:phage I-like protein
VTIDFEHNTLEGTPAYKESKEPRPVAGRGIPLLTPNGIELTNIEWTSEGRKMAEHFGDLSPAPWHEDGTVLGLHSVALVRNGAIYELSFCSADNTNPKENEMKDLLAALTAAKLIPEAGTEKDVVVLIQGLTASAEASKSALAALTALTADQVKAIAVDVAKAEVSALTAEVTGLKAENLQIQKDHLLELAKFEGKVVPLTADTIKTLTVEKLKEQIAAIKPSVPLAQRTIATGLSAGGGVTGPTDVQASVAKACGLDASKIDWAGK